VSAVPVAPIRSAWSRAGDLAARTPPDRNRYVDFLRALSIFVVVIGHWLMAAPSFERGEFTLSDMLRIAPGTQWLTWIFQVMPLFFIVGGYGNAASWERARSAGENYATWISRRFQRLVRPMIPVVAVWSGVAIAGERLGLSPRSVEIGSQVALVPIWFLAVYVMVVAAVPATCLLWRRFGVGSFLALAVAAAAVDAAWRVSGRDSVGWLNFAFVWLAVHQLGYAWRDGWFAGAARALLWGVGGLAALAALVGWASYPISMVTVPGEEFSNSSPPTLSLLALGVCHAGLILAVEQPACGWLRRGWAWTATVFVNGAIMTLYLWHATAMVLLVELAYRLGAGAFAFEPNSAAWWATRPLWVLCLCMVLSMFVSIFGRFETFAKRLGEPPPSAWRSIAGAVAICAGLAALATGGIGTTGLVGIRVWPVLLTLAGAILVAAVRLPRPR
jgi:peptidoglycan/LPS O-acetylase OafA/YrhL